MKRKDNQVVYSMGATNITPSASGNPNDNMSNLRN